MKRAIGYWLVCGAALVAACDDTNNNADVSAPQDLSASVDMRTAADLKMADAAMATDSAIGDANSSDGSLGDGGTRNCIGIVTCLNGCGSNNACQDACVASGKPASQMKFQALLACGYGVCTMPADGGSPACASNTDRSAGCQSCLNSAAVSPTCGSQFAACSADQ